MSLLSYTEFLFESYKAGAEIDVKVNFLRAISNKILKNREDKLFVEHVISRGHSNQLFEAIEKNDYNLLVESIKYDALFEETFFQKFKRKTMEVINTVKEKGKQALSAGQELLMKFGGNILQPLQWIVKQIAGVITKAWGAMKSLAMKAVEAAKEKIAGLVSKYIGDGEEMAEKGKNLIKELGNLDGMLGAGVAWITSGFSSAVVKTGSDAAKEDTSESNYYSSLYTAMLHETTEMINNGYSIDAIIQEGEAIKEYEKSINEGGDGKKLNIPFISGLMDKIAHMPPFSWFHKLGDKAKEFSNNALGNLSYILTKVAEAPGPYEFEIIGGLVGVAVSYFAESGAKEKLHHYIEHIEHLFHFAIPGLSTVFTAIKIIGISLAVYGVVKELFGKKGHKVPKVEVKDPEEEKEDEDEKK